MPRIIPFHLLEQREVTKELAEALEKGQTLVYPTDTVYGMGCRADSDQACKLIDRMKNRPSGQVYSVALGSLSMLNPMILLQDNREKKLLDSILPGPYTVLVRLRDTYRIPANQHLETLGIRIPKLPLLQKLISELSFPLVTTSVNRSGEAPQSDPTEILKCFPDIDFLLDAGPLWHTVPSTILDISGGQPYIIRRRAAGFQ